MNLIWSVLAGAGVEDPAPGCVRKTSRITGEDSEAVKALTSGLEGSCRRFRAECLVNVLMQSPLLKDALALDPVNTYSVPVWPKGSVLVETDLRLWTGYFSNPDAWKPPVEELVLTLDGAGDKVKVSGKRVSKELNMGTYDGLTSVLEVSPALSLRFQGDLAGMSGVVTVTDSCFPVFDAAELIASLPSRDWVDGNLYHVWDGGTPVERLSAYTLDCVRQKLDSM